jgi:hypothetical protein
MSSVWREVTSWCCDTCVHESLLVERDDRASGRSAAFERRCAWCGALAPGTTIRPAGTAYQVTTRRDFYPKRAYPRRGAPASAER